MSLKPAILPPADPSQHRLKYWRERRGLSQRDLEERTGIAQNSIHRLENGKMEFKTHHLRTFARALSIRTIDILPLDYLDSETQDGQLSEPEALPYISEPKTCNKRSNKIKFVDIFLENNPRRHAWTLKTNALIYQGYKRGDVLIVDEDRTPAVGDIVCAQIYSQTDAETVFRIYQPPFLLAASAPGEMTTPMLIDNSRVRIIGAVTESIRQKN